MLYFRVYKKIVGNPSGYTIKGFAFFSFPIFFSGLRCFISVVINVMRGVPSFFKKNNKKISDKSS